MKKLLALCLPLIAFSAVAEAKHPRLLIIEAASKALDTDCLPAMGQGAKAMTCVMQNRGKLDRDVRKAMRTLASPTDDELRAIQTAGVEYSEKAGEMMKMAVKR